MFTKELIDEIKTGKPSSITYSMIADATAGKCSLADVKKFFAHKTVPFTKGLEIVKALNAVIAEQKQQVQEAMSK
ncbi:MAG: hypothetical protein JWO03_897 [Bacteroidetes bacterium]|nr:hypothetical protein [Bacteroidota bacterium]